MKKLSKKVEPLALADPRTVFQAVPVPAPQSTPRSGDLSGGSGLGLLPQAHCPVL